MSEYIAVGDAAQDLLWEWRCKYPTMGFDAWRAEMKKRYPTMDTSKVINIVSDTARPCPKPGAAPLWKQILEKLPGVAAKGAPPPGVPGVPGVPTPWYKQRWVTPAAIGGAALLAFYFIRRPKGKR